MLFLVSTELGSNFLQLRTISQRKTCFFFLINFRLLIKIYILFAVYSDHFRESALYDF